MIEAIIAIAAAALFVLLLPRMAQGGIAKRSGPYDVFIAQQARANNLPFEVLKAQVQKESAFDPRALGDRNLKNHAYGLLQIRQPALTDYNNAHGTMLTLADMYDPQTNLIVGAWYVGQLVQRHGLSIGLEMYNVGEEGFQNGARSGYASAVMAISNDYA